MIWRRLVDWWRGVQEPFDVDFPDSDLGGYADRTPEGIDCPTTQPTSPGALESDLGGLYEENSFEDGFVYPVIGGRCGACGRRVDS